MEKTDLTTQAGIESLMRSSKSENEWNDNCDKVKAANGGDYPKFRYTSIIQSGLLYETKYYWK